VLANLSFAAALLVAQADVGVTPLLAVPLAPGDASISCPDWILNEDLRRADHVCIRTTTGQARQDHYTRELGRAGWKGAGGLANVLGFERGRHCLALIGVPMNQKDEKAIGLRNLFDPLPPESEAVFMFVRVARPKAGDCAP
jgi:hypothetical protein